MRKLYNNLFESLGVIGLVLFILFIAGLIIFPIAMSIYGIYLAFSASIILGIAALFVEPAPFVFGVVMFFFDKNLPQMIVDFLSK